MRKKIFLQKGSQKSGHRLPVRAILLSAVCLLILVVITPLITRQRVGKDSSRKGSSERGIVMKEIPKPSDSSSDAEPGRTATTEVAPGGLQNEMPPAVDRKPVEGAPAPAKGDAVVDATGTGKTPEQGGTPPGPNQGWIDMKAKGAQPMPPGVSDQSRNVDARPAPQAPAGQKVASVPPPAPPAEVRKETTPPAPAKPKAAERKKEKERTPPPKETAKAPPKAAPASGKTLYSVQVGLFKSRGNAEEMLRNLQKRGYDVVLAPTKHPNLGDVFIVRLKPVDNMGKASTQVEQIKHEEKVKPIILKITGEE